MYDNLYTCEWKAYGLGDNVSSDAKVEVIDLEESEEVKETNIPILKKLFLVFRCYKSNALTWWRTVSRLFG